MRRMHKYGESKMTQIMMATVPHVTSSSGLRKFQADGFLLDSVYQCHPNYSRQIYHIIILETTELTVSTVS